MEPLSLPLWCNPKLHYPSLLEGFLYSPTSFYLAIISVQYLSQLHKEQSYCSVSFFTCSKSPPFWFLPVTMYQDALHKCVLTFLHRGKRIILGSVTQYRNKGRLKKKTSRTDISMVGMLLFVCKQLTANAAWDQYHVTTPIL